MNPKQKIEAALWERAKELAERNDSYDELSDILGNLKILGETYYDNSPEIDMQLHEGPHCACVPQKGRLPIN